MSLFTIFSLPTVGPGPLVRAKASQTRSSTHQLNVKEDSLDLEDTVAAVSRRKMLGLAGLSLAMVSLSSPKPAEARMTRTEMKNKILKKLRELREKAGIPMPKDEDEEHASEPEKDSVPDRADEQKISASQEDERQETAPKQEGKDGKSSALQTEDERIEESTPPKDNAPFLPFLNLTEVELEPFGRS